MDALYLDFVLPSALIEQSLADTKFMMITWTRHLKNLEERGTSFPASQEDQERSSKFRADIQLIIDLHGEIIERSEKILQQRIEDPRSDTVAS